jgi:signal transduction histidine kinase
VEVIGKGERRLRTILGIAGAVYLFWWFTVEVSLPGSFNPLPGRLLVVGVGAALLVASFWSAAVSRHLSGLFTAWVCLLVAHYTYLLVGNHGDSAWWVGAFVTFAATALCLQSPREVALFSVFSMTCVVYAAAVEGQLTRTIYVPGLATILLLANVTKRSQAAAQEATLRAEAEARSARDAAEAANRDLEAFNYSVAHDLRAPLRAIDGFSGALREDFGSELRPEARLHLDRVRDAAAHMGRLIDGLLSLSRLTGADLHCAPVDLSALARATFERLRASQPERAVEFVVRDGLETPGDRALLGAVLENLLGNAWKFTRDRKDARIELGAADKDGETVYFVRDNGVGFDMAYAAKLFGVFQRLHAPSEFEGTGIGLATVQRIVQRHGGRVWGEGKVGEGACFRFTLT